MRRPESHTGGKASKIRRRGSIQGFRSARRLPKHQTDKFLHSSCSPGRTDPSLPFSKNKKKIKKIPLLFPLHLHNFQQGLSQTSSVFHISAHPSPPPAAAFIHQSHALSSALERDADCGLEGQGSHQGSVKGVTVCQGFVFALLPDNRGRDGRGALGGGDRKRK